MYSQDEIDDLIALPKNVDKAPKNQLSLERGHWRNSMSLMSDDKAHHFEVNFRKNDRFPENFSIVLRYKSADGRPSIVLLRLNGPHGFHESYSHHAGTHIHKAKSEFIEEGLKEEGYIEMTKNYTTFEEAVGHLKIAANIKNTENYAFLNKTEQLGLSLSEDD